MALFTTILHPTHVFLVASYTPIVGLAAGVSTEVDVSASSSIPISLSASNVQTKIGFTVSAAPVIELLASE